MGTGRNSAYGSIKRKVQTFYQNIGWKDEDEGKPLLEVNPGMSDAEFELAYREWKHNYTRWLKSKGYSDSDIEKAIADVNVKVENERANRQARVLKGKEDVLIQRQKDIVSGKVLGKGAVLAKEQLHRAGQMSQAGARSMGGRAATRSRVYGRGTDTLNLKGAQAFKTLREAEKEQAQQNVLQMEQAQERGELVEARLRVKQSLDDQLLEAQKESDSLGAILGVGGAIIGGIAGGMATGGAGAYTGATTGYAIGTGIGSNV
jgi:hypothetical protein